MAEMQRVLDKLRADIISNWKKKTGFEEERNERRREKGNYSNEMQENGNENFMRDARKRRAEPSEEDEEGRNPRNRKERNSIETEGFGNYKKDNSQQQNITSNEVMRALGRKRRRNVEDIEATEVIQLLTQFRPSKQLPLRELEGHRLLNIF